MAEGHKPPTPRHHMSNDVQQQPDNGEEEEEEEAAESVKLFVGQVPKHVTESHLLSFFRQFALVDQVNIIRDKATRASRGCCFVMCPSREEADKAVNACHNKQTLPGASSPLQVKYADGELERLEHKLFIGMLPKNVTKAEVYNLFSIYGSIKDLQILRGSQQTGRGCAFLKYETKDQALSAMEAINGKHKMEGSAIPLVVKWADTEKERQARKAQKANLISAAHNPDSPYHPSLFGALPMGYALPYSGYGYQASGTYGLMPYRLPHNQAAFASITSSLNRGSALLPNIQYPLAYRGGVGNLSDSPISLHRPPLFSNSALSPGVRISSGSQAEGPPGANLFIYQIPQEFGDKELATAFQRFGRVLSAKVFVDKATGVSKCFGFVSYDSLASAQNAISVMNGCELGGKKLKVQLKRENNLNKLY
uniref:RRM domain-containing protein n=1 Tax=Kalanchoe fedtschenkoi TaxID=63787 RepID=A0A7N0ULC1_KALFE